MAIEIRVPRLGWNMEEGVFAGWLKRDGESVREGEPLFTLQTDKATQDVEAIDAGTLAIPPEAPAVGDRVVVGAILGHLVGSGESPIRPEPASVAASSPPSPANGREGRRRSTPLARRLAREMGVDWTRLAGTGNGGRVRKLDILAAAPPPATAPPTSIPMNPARRTIAARMVVSHATTAPVTLTTPVDATNLVNLRGQYRATGLEAPSYLDVVVKLAAIALGDHPMLNARWADDRIEMNDEAHVGIAVDTDAGLFVPVIRSAAGLSLGAIAEESRALIALARAGRLGPGNMQGGTFTVTNLGGFGIEAFTPLLNPPETAILGMGRIAREPAMDGDRVVGRDRMVLSLTFDHRVVDGAPAARFLRQLGTLIENPGPWLIG